MAQIRRAPHHEAGMGANLDTLLATVAADVVRSSGAGGMLNPFLMVTMAVADLAVANRWIDCHFATHSRMYSTCLSSHMARPSGR